MEILTLIISVVALVVAVFSYLASKENNKYSHKPMMHPIPTNFRVFFDPDEIDPDKIKFQRIGLGKEGDLVEGSILEHINLETKNIGRGVATNISLDWDEKKIYKVLLHNLKDLTSSRHNFDIKERNSFYLIKHTYQNSFINSKTFFKNRMPLKAHNICFPNAEESILLYLPEELSYLIKVRLHKFLFERKGGFPFVLFEDQNPFFESTITFKDIFSNKPQKKKIKFYFHSVFDPDKEHALLKLYFDPDIIY